MIQIADIVILVLELRFQIEGINHSRIRWL